MWFGDDREHALVIALLKTSLHIEPFDEVAAGVWLARAVNKFDSTRHRPNRPRINKAPAFLIDHRLPTCIEVCSVALPSRCM